jgi:hypothetical protein
MGDVEFGCEAGDVVRRTLVVLVSFASVVG